LFLYHYTKYFKFQEAQNELENILHSLLGSKMDCNEISFAEGLSGTLWSIRFLINENILELDDFSGFLKESDDFLLDKINEFDKTKDFDFLYGIIGLGNYFVESENFEMIDLIINKLDDWSVKGFDNCKWVSNIHINQVSTGVYDLGLAHGISSIIIFLSKCLTLKHESKTKELLQYSVNYLLLSEKLSEAKVLPAYILEKNNIYILNYRLAWCYGELGTSIALWHAGCALNDIKLKNKAIKVCIKTTYRKKKESTQIMDAGFCHGSSGVAHIYKIMFEYTGIDKFDKASAYWINKTLLYSKHKDGLAGYKAWHEDNGYYNEYGILEGVSGIGLVLLGFLTNNNTKWDKCLLIR
jgi:hypothetical protein